MSPIRLFRSSRSFFRLVVSGWLAACVAASPVLAQTRPISGTAVGNFAPLDRTVLEFMDRLKCTAATVAVSRGGKLIYSRGYGWSDAHQKKPTPPDAVMRIAGLTQRITTVAVKKLIREGKLSLDTRAFRSLNLKPPKGAVPDPRLFQITVGQLLDNQGGWDLQAAFDPFTRLREIQKSLHLSHRPHPNDVIRYMLGQPLQFGPGQRTAPSNLGYCVLGRMIEKASGKSYEKYIEEDLMRPLGINDVKLARSLPREREPSEVWYPVKDVVVEITDSYGGLVASAPSLCKFFDAYWADGNPRHATEDLQFSYSGNFEGTTAFIRQRPDGDNIAVLFNGRRDASRQEEDDRALEQAVNDAVDQVGRQGHRGDGSN
jgi:CubicO group peptidase (beta-lactamase class C family)